MGKLRDSLEQLLIIFKEKCIVAVIAEQQEHVERVVHLPSPHKSFQPESNSFDF